MRIAVTGAAHWHLGLFLPTLRDEADVVAVHDADPVAAQRIITELLAVMRAWFADADYSLVPLRPGGRVFVGEVGCLMPAQHSTRDHYVIATSPTDVEIVAPDGSREHVKAHTTNVPHYPVFVRDALRRVREGEPPLASLTDMAAVMDLTHDAYALAGPLPARPPAQEDSA
jgi:hypothetical protein